MLQAAHIRPYAQSGLDAPDHDLLLRSDLETPLRSWLRHSSRRRWDFRVSQRIKAEIENGRDDDALDGREELLAGRGSLSRREFLSGTRT